MIRVLIVDDSPTMRELLVRMLSSDPEINVVGAAPDPFIAREMIIGHSPDVLTLDIEMPKLDGLSFLSRLMRLHPMPVVMISALTSEGADTTLRALEMGAVDCICKPRIAQEGEMLALRGEVIAKIKAAAHASIRAVRQKVGRTALRWPAGHRTADPESVIAIGASTGGVAALMEVLAPLPADAPPILVVQHMPAAFISPFARRLDLRCAAKVQVATDNVMVLPGHVYVAPGNRHLLIERADGVLRCRLESGERVNGHIPSVDKLFNSAAAAVGRHAVGVLLSGMGKDGASGLSRMRRVGALTICQDEDSSVVYGMPKAAMALGAAKHQLPLGSISPFILEQCCAERALTMEAAPAGTTDGARTAVWSKSRALSSAPSSGAGELDERIEGPQPGVTGGSGTRSVSVWVAPSDFYVTCNTAEVLHTILGSCIAVCIRDPVIRCGGMNHFLLPNVPEPRSSLPSLELRYGSYSIERLINAVLSRGGRRERLEIKIFGGGNILGSYNIGHYNADFVEAYLEKEGLAVAAKDLRGTAPRRIQYRPFTGQVLMSRPRDVKAAMQIDEELRTRVGRIIDRSSGDAEIFSQTIGTAYKAKGRQPGL